MAATQAPLIGGYRVEEGKNGVWFLVDDEGRTRGTFFSIGGGRWRGTTPRGEVVEHDVGDAAKPHMVMARRLVGGG